MTDLTGKVALITGACGLLGIQHATALLASGANVVLTDIDIEKNSHKIENLKELYGSDRLLTIRMDITEDSSVRSVLDEVINYYGRLDILINNAAIDAKVSNDEGVINSARFESFALAAWNKEIQVGLTGAFLCSQVFGTWMADNGGGVILNIASDLSVISPDQRLYREPGKSEHEQRVKPVTYSVIKTALIGLTRYLATYWADKNIRVNALSPGGVYCGQGDAFVSRLSSLIPMARMASEDEYHGAIVFLCSEASKYMTGQNIVMDGGRSVW